MNRALIITIGIVTILFVCGIWIFLLIFGAPEKPSDVFSDLGITQPIERSNSEEISGTIGSNDVFVGINGSNLQQLTTESVSGFAFRGKDIVRYVEAGTAHIYEINLVSGEKKQISRTTIPRITSAIFSPDTSVVALIPSSESEQIILAEIPKNIDLDLQRTLLPLGAKNISFRDDATVLYSRSTLQQTIGYSRTATSSTETKEFTLDIPDMLLVWGNGLEKVAAYTAPTEHLQGYVYVVEDDALTPVGTPAFGLLPIIHNEKFIFTSVDKDEEIYTSTLYEIDADGTIDQPLVMLPEKCVFENSDMLWCGAEYEIPESDYVENWYKGTNNPQDFLWQVDLQTHTAQLVADPTSETGRNIDTLSMTINSDKTRLGFINKLDGGLWVYTIPTVN